LQQRNILLDQLKKKLERAQIHMKKQANKNRRHMEFVVGDLVLVKLQPYRQHSLALRNNNKLTMRYFGLFEIINRIGTVAYKLKLPPIAVIHPMFHVLGLKPFKGDVSQPYMSFLLLTNEKGT